MSDMKGIAPSVLRIDTSGASKYLYADQPKLSFMQKLGRIGGKILSVGGGIASAVTGAMGMLPLSMGLYGVSKIAGDATSVALQKDATKMAEYNQQQAGKSITIPGLFEGMSPAEISTDFIAPSQYHNGITQALINKDAAVSENMRM